MMGQGTNPSGMGTPTPTSGMNRIQQLTLTTDIEKDIYPNFCQYTLRRGERKGTACGALCRKFVHYCYQHSPERKSKERTRYTEEVKAELQFKADQLAAHKPVDDNTVTEYMNAWRKNKKVEHRLERIMKTEKKSMKAQVRAEVTALVASAAAVATPVKVETKKR